MAAASQLRHDGAHDCQMAPTIRNHHSQQISRNIHLTWLKDGDSQTSGLLWIDRNLLPLGPFPVLTADDVDDSLNSIEPMPSRDVEGSRLNVTTSQQPQSLVLSNATASRSPQTHGKGPRTWHGNEPSMTRTIRAPQAETKRIQTGAEKKERVKNHEGAKILRPNSSMDKRMRSSGNHLQQPHIGRMQPVISQYPISEQEELERGGIGMDHHENHRLMESMTLNDDFSPRDTLSYEYDGGMDEMSPTMVSPSSLTYTGSYDNAPHTAYSTMKNTQMELEDKRRPKCDSSSANTHGKEPRDSYGNKSTVKKHYLGAYHAQQAEIQRIQTGTEKNEGIKNYGGAKILLPTSQMETLRRSSGNHFPQSRFGRMQPVLSQYRINNQEKLQRRGIGMDHHEILRLKESSLSTVRSNTKIERRKRSSECNDSDECGSSVQKRGRSSGIHLQQPRFGRIQPVMSQYPISSQDEEENDGNEYDEFSDVNSMDFDGPTAGGEGSYCNSPRMEYSTTQNTVSKMTGNRQEKKQRLFGNNRKNPITGRGGNSVKEKTERSSGIHLQQPCIGRRFKCHFEGCNHSTRDKKSMEGHSRIHTGEFPFACTYCGHRDKTLSNHVKHESRHRNVKPYTCQVCGTAYKDKKNVDNHMLSKHVTKGQCQCNSPPTYETQHSRLRVPKKPKYTAMLCTVHPDAGRR